MGMMSYIGSERSHGRCNMRGYRGGPTLTTVFVDVFLKVDEGKADPKPLKAGHHPPASEMPFKWRFAGGPMMAQH